MWRILQLNFFLVKVLCRCSNNPSCRLTVIACDVCRAYYKFGVWWCRHDLTDSRNMLFVVCVIPTIIPESFWAFRNSVDIVPDNKTDRIVRVKFTQKQGSQSDTLYACIENNFCQTMAYTHKNKMPSISLIHVNLSCCHQKHNNRIQQHTFQQVLQIKGKKCLYMGGSSLSPNISSNIGETLVSDWFLYAI